MRQYDRIILGENCVTTTDVRLSGRNNHVLVIGATGSGKTRSVVEPALLETRASSIVVSDPKGRLYDAYGSLLAERGFLVRSVDFAHPEKSAFGYDPFRFLCENADALYGESGKKGTDSAPRTRDIQSLARLLIRADPDHAGRTQADPFWEDMGEVALCAVMALLSSYCDRRDRTMREVIRLTSLYRYTADSDRGMSQLDRIFDLCRKALGEDCYAVRQYRLIRQCPEKTLSGVLTLVNSMLGRISSAEVLSFMDRRQMLSVSSLLQKKTALFVQPPEVDLTLGYLVNVFYTQLMQYLFAVKDREKNAESLPVRFILDDFASGIVIPDMPRWISVMREREMSLMLILQSVTQLQAIYGEADARTIIANCDNMVYLRSNDPETAKEFSARLGLPVYDLLYTPTGEEYVFMSGAYPVRTKRYDITAHAEYKRTLRRQETGSSKQKTQ